MRPTFTLTTNDRPVSFEMELDPAVPTDAHLWAYASNGLVPEMEVVAVMVRALKPGDIAIDCGANIGFFTMLMSLLVGDSGLVVAFEPSPVNVPKLNHNIALNRRNNVQVYNNPLWSERKTVWFADDADGGLSAVVSALPVADSMQGVPVARPATTRWAETLDQQTFSKVPKMIKIDVEGSEQKVLEGASKMLDKHPPYIVAEMNVEALEKLGCSQQSLRAFMHSRGYETFVLAHNDDIPVHLPPTTVLDVTRQNTNLLYATVEDVGKLWPEVRV